MLTPRGIVSSSWECGAGGGNGNSSSASTDTAVCAPSSHTLGGMITEMWNPARTAEIGSLTLTCTDGGTIKAIDFASYGLPTGTCAQGYMVDSKCDAADTADKVRGLCVGKQACTIVGAFSIFGDPCLDTVKRLAVIATGCKGTSTTNVPPTPPPPNSNLFSYAVVVPSGATADVHLPAMGRGVGNVTVTEGAATIWRNGQYVDGTPGIRSAKAGAAGEGGQEMVVEVMSGSYRFLVN